MTRYSIMLFCFFLSFSCSQKNNKSNINQDDLTLVKVDSIQISYLGMLNLMDVHPESEKLLMFDQQKRSLIISGFDGSNPKELANESDSPDSYGSFPLGAGKFSEDGKSFTMISNQGVYTYDLDGNLINGGKHQEKEMPAFSGRASADNEFYWIGDRILTNGAGRTEYSRDTPEFYENYTSFAWFDTLDRKVEKFMNFDEQSVFRNGKAHEIPHFIPRMTVDQDRIYFIQGIEPALNINEVKKPYDKIKRVNFDFKDYYFNKGQNFKDVDPRAISMDVYSGMFENIKILDKYILITFFPGVPELEQSKYEDVAYMEVIPKTRKDYPSRLLILDLEGKKLSDHVIPKEFDSRQWLVRDGHIWFLATVNLEEEEDFVKVFKVKLGKN